VSTCHDDDDDDDNDKVVRHGASSLLPDGSASSMFDIHSKKPAPDLDEESSSNECICMCRVVSQIGASDKRFLSSIILCSNETIVFDHAIDITNKCLRIHCQLSTSRSLCVLKGSSKSGLFQAIDSSYQFMSFQGVTFSGGSSEFGSVVQVIVSSRDSASDPRMKNCYPSSPPVAANSKLDFWDCTFQDNVMGCVFRNNTATHARTAAFAFAFLISALLLA
jgi:hypothetical protein